jgi:hypothetical protein
MNRDGQALIELLGSAALLILALTGGGSLFKTEWNRLKCAYLTFEIGHQKLAQESNDAESGRSVRGDYENGLVNVQIQGDGILASAQCGQSHEAVKLLNLEKSL